MKEENVIDIIVKLSNSVSLAKVLLSYSRILKNNKK